MLHLLGVKRLPALLTTGLSLEEIGIPRYEIANCEPLHDLKNVINHLLNELPHHLDDMQPELKEKITTFCNLVTSKLMTGN